LADFTPEVVLIHDAARPLVQEAVVDRLLAAIGQWAGVIPALPVTDTLKLSDPDRPDQIRATIGRAGLWRAQTPQAFHYAEILDAHRRCVGGAFTDDAAIAEACGLTVGLVAGDEANIKITSEKDIVLAETMLLSTRQCRVGFGYDVHRFGEGDRVMLCGVPIPHARGLLGHSDADVALHALTDAIFGALADGDIGVHFPPTDARWKGAPSETFLAHARDLVAAAGGEVMHVDVTIVCERPKVGPHRLAMRSSLATILGLSIGRVSVKATTTERLGFTGREEGIAAHAVATLLLPSQ
jgi:2-C-methyl-D-erythritol 4-phosphate cytidylyltransferase/2-C-methyl-D-erythritol 2,4-cyclodiphosphate synthase